MIKASRNQLANVNNPFQGGAKRVLCVCSAGLLRSPTMANVLHREYGYNTRSCGACESFALIPLTEALIAWADQIVFTNDEAFDDMDAETLSLVSEKDYIVLNTPDHYDYGDEELQARILQEYLQYVKEGK